jgi:hypothetical protein
MLVNRYLRASAVGLPFRYAILPLPTPAMPSSQACTGHSHYSHFCRRSAQCQSFLVRWRELIEHRHKISALLLAQLIPPLSTLLLVTYSPEGGCQINHLFAETTLRASLCIPLAHYLKAATFCYGIQKHFHRRLPGSRKLTSAHPSS